MDKNGRDKFDELFRDLMSGKNEEHPIPSEVGKIECPIPPEGQIYEYLFEVSNFFYYRFTNDSGFVCVAKRSWKMGAMVGPD